MKTPSDYSRDYRHRNPEKAKAHAIVGEHIKNGRLVPLPCEKCGNPDTHAHHEDYSKPLEVVWLCQPCHVQRHIELAEGKPKPAKAPRKPKPRSTRVHPKRDTLLASAQQMRNEGQAYEAIAEALGVTKGTVYKWLNKPTYK